MSPEDSGMVVSGRSQVVGYGFSGEDMREPVSHRIRVPRLLLALPFTKEGPMRLATIMIVAGAALSPSMTFAQMPRTLDPDPNLPTKEGFDVDRALFWTASNFVPLRDPEWQSLRDVRRAGDVADDTPVLVFEAGGSTLILISSQMAYHHVAQGEMNGEPWMVTF